MSKKITSLFNFKKLQKFSSALMLPIAILPAAGLVKLGDGGVQVIFGGKSQILRDEIKTVMSRPRPTEMTVACAN